MHTIVDLTGPDDARWQKALPVLRELRPHLTPELLQQVLSEGSQQGLTFTVVLDGDDCLAIAGWRVISNTSAIRKLYIDDLSTIATARSQGLGKLLIDHLVDRARSLKCVMVDLDSGVQRYDAHRFYLRERFDIVSHHFSRRL